MSNKSKILGLPSSTFYFTEFAPDVTQTSTTNTSPDTLKTITFTALDLLPENGNRVQWEGSFRLVKADESAFYLAIYVNGGLVEQIAGIPAVATSGGNFRISLRRKDATTFIFSSNIGFTVFGEAGAGLISYAGADFTFELKGSVDNSSNAIYSFDAELIGGGGY